MSQPAPAPDPSGQAAALAVVLDRLVGQLVALYTDAETALITSITREARTGVNSAPYAEARLQMLYRMRQVAQTIAARLQMRSTPLARSLVDQASRDGDAAAVRTLRRLVQSNRTVTGTLIGRLDYHVPPIGGHALASANNIAIDLVAKLTAANQRITRFGDDAYRAATAEASTRQVLGLQTPASAQSSAWRALTSRGVAGFTDRTGRSWNLSAYVEMATRSSTQRAYNASHLDRMTAVGIDLFAVPDDGHPCPLCLPWQGKILSAAPDDRAAATIDEATAAGLFHPNCRHVLGPYIPGVTRLAKTGTWTADDERNYAATQTLRRLEREVRAAKREQVGALNELDRKRADRLVRQRQATIRDHVQATGLVRRPRREQLNLGNR